MLITKLNMTTLYVGNEPLTVESTHKESLMRKLCLSHDVIMWTNMTPLCRQITISARTHHTRDAKQWSKLFLIFSILFHDLYRSNTSSEAPMWQNSPWGSLTNLATVLGFWYNTTPLLKSLPTDGHFLICLLNHKPCYEIDVSCTRFQ